MCGIAGLLALNGSAPARPVLQAMCDAIRHRGPDDQGYFTSGPVALGHRRLSIIDLGGGHQPLGNEDGSVQVVFNGEIYNFPTLRKELEERGHRFRTHSDTEVIVHAWEEYGPACVERFRGMFAFAVWDGGQRTLLLARDRTGKKPLFYAVAGGELIFASELQAIVRHPAVSRDVDPVALREYLTCGYVPAPLCIFRGVRKLPAGHTLAVPLAPPPADTPVPEPQPYWRLAFAPKRDVPAPRAVEELRELLTEAVRVRLVADVPLGALLSGGIDSSLVVALMAGLSAAPVKTFSIGFPEQDFNELPFARLVADRYGTEHHEFVVEPKAVEALPLLVRHYGEPFADSSAVPTYYVSRLTRQHVTVALNGDGGDESFAGYDRHVGGRLVGKLTRLPAALRYALHGLSRLIPHTLPRRHRLLQLRRILLGVHKPLAEQYFGWMCVVPPAQQTALFRPELCPAAGEPWLLGLLRRALVENPDVVDGLLDADVRSYLPYDLLVKADVASMANSLELRSPFLDHHVMEYAARLPPGLKARGREQKYLLKQLGQALLPPQILSRRKMGFGVPVGHWMRGELRPLVEDLLLAPNARITAYFQPAALHRLVREHLDNRQDWTAQLWALLWLELWHREFTG